MVKRKSRIQKLGNEIEQEIQNINEDKIMNSLENDQLFKMDKVGFSTLREKFRGKRVKCDGISSKKLNVDKISKFEKDAIAKIKANKVKESVEKIEPTLKLWEEKVETVEEFTEQVGYLYKRAKRNIVASTKFNVNAVDLPKGGVSYHPEFDDHQNALAEALALEMEKEQQRRLMKEPVSKGLCEETKKYVVEGDDLEKDDTDENNDTEEEQVVKEGSGKYTRAKRNRMMRKKLKDLEDAAIKDKKMLGKGINASYHISNEIKNEEKDCARKREIKQFYQQQKLLKAPQTVRVGAKKVVVENTPVVALSDELHGSLRALKPKGSLLAERFANFHQRNMMEVGGKKKKQKRPKHRYIEY